MKRREWDDIEVAILRDLYPNFKTEHVAAVLGMPVPRVNNKAHMLGLKKSAEYLASPAAGRWDGKRGVAHRFQKGQQAWNKGLKGVVGVQAECRKTQFKKGQNPHNTHPIGSYRITKDGTLQRKINNDKGSNSVRWRGVHELVWIDANGPVPAGHIVVFKAGMRTTELSEITADKVECITYADNMRRNTLHRYPKEIADLMRLRGVLHRQINRKEKQHEQND